MRGVLFDHVADGGGVGGRSVAIGDGLTVARLDDLVDPAHEGGLKVVRDTQVVGRGLVVARCARLDDVRCDDDNQLGFFVQEVARTEQRAEDYEFDTTREPVSTPEPVSLQDKDDDPDKVDTTPTRLIT